MVNCFKKSAWCLPSMILLFQSLCIVNKMHFLRFTWGPGAWLPRPWPRCARGWGRGRGTCRGRHRRAAACWGSTPPARAPAAIGYTTHTRLSEIGENIIVWLLIYMAVVCRTPRGILCLFQKIWWIKRKRHQKLRNLYITHNSNRQQLKKNTKCIWISCKFHFLYKEFSPES